MRKYIVAGNWKMNTTVPEGVELAKAVVEKAKELPANVELVVAPPFTHLASVAEVLKGSKVALSAQNCADHEKGAYTGEVSVNMLTSVGCTYTILGHSERRQYYGETDEKLVEKTKLALAAGLKVILCVGENLEEREAGRHFDVVTVQTKNVLYNFSAEEMKNVVIAYEPVWAIGTGLTATDEQANETIGVIRKAIGYKFGEEAAAKIRIQYGGRMNPKNVKRLMAQPEIDCCLIGGASLKSPDCSLVVNYDKHSGRHPRPCYAAGVSSSKPSAGREEHAVYRNLRRQRQRQKHPGPRPAGQAG